MRFLGVTETCDLAALYLRLADDGHEVKLSIEEPLAQGTLAGLLPRVSDWRAELEWIRGAGSDGIIIFEAVSEGLGALQDQLRGDGFNVIGGSTFGDRLENDRAFAQSLLGELGFPSGHIWEFSDAGEADAFLESRPGRYVLKFSGPDFASNDNYIGQLDDGRDVRAVLAAKLNQYRSAPVTFVLMEYVEGVEMGIGAYFDGSRFILPACLDWEHKRFFADDLGELTGEMGTVATFERSRAFFDRTLALIEPQLRDAGHVGYVNMNTIVNDAGIWPLEFTSRFGYPGYAVLDPLQETGWADLFARMVKASDREFLTRPGFSVGVLLSTPPFPYSRKDVDESVGLPVFFGPEFSADDRRNCHFGEIGLADGQLVTSGLYGWTMVVTGVDRQLANARRAAYERARQIFVPNVRYRLDIGERLIAHDWAFLESMGVFGD